MDQMDQMQMMQQMQQKVMGFEHHMGLIKAFVGKQDRIKGFRFDISMNLSSFFTISNSWNIPNHGMNKPKNMM